MLARSFLSLSLPILLNAVVFFDNTTFNAIETKFRAILNLSIGLLDFIMSNNIKSIHIRAPWRIIDELMADFDRNSIQYQRGTLNFSAGALEWIDVLIPLSSAAVGTLGGIIVAKLGQDKSVTVTYHDNGNIASIKAPTQEQFIEIHDKIKDVTIK